MTGGHIIAELLRRENVHALFTLCGGHIQDIYDGCLDRGIRVVDFRHEQSAAHAADGWARVTGEPGVAAVTAGPGVTDAVTAVANAQRANIPLLLLGGQAPLSLRTKGALQEMDHVALLRPITKWSAAVPSTERLADHLAQAFRIAAAPPRGPVFLELPLDVLMGELAPGDLQWPTDYRTRSLPAGDPAAIDRAADLLRAARRPVVLVGSQAFWTRDPAATLTRFADWLRAPIFVNGQARGILDPDHPCLFTLCRSQALAAADLILNFGTPLDFRLKYGDESAFPAATPLISVDLDPAELGRNRAITAGIIGDSGLVMQQLIDATGTPGDYAEFLASIRAADQARRASLQPQSTQRPIHPHRLAAALNQTAPRRTIYVGDGGDVLASMAKILRVHGPGQWLDPGPLGTLGVGTGYAMAAKLARPDHEVVILYGDGSFGFNGMDFEAAARQGIAIKAVIGNDGAWSQIRRGQVMLYGPDRAPATTLTPAHYERVVEALGGAGEYIDDPADLEAACTRMFQATGPYVLNVRVGADPLRAMSLSV